MGVSGQQYHKNLGYNSYSLITHEFSGQNNVRWQNYLKKQSQQKNHRKPLRVTGWVLKWQMEFNVD